MNDIEKNINQFSNQKLVEIIVSSRYLGILKEQSILCMEELVKRRKNGEIFDFESAIEEELKKLPQFKINLKKLIFNGFNMSEVLGKINDE